MFACRTRTGRPESVRSASARARRRAAVAGQGRAPSGVRAGAAWAVDGGQAGGHGRGFQGWLTRRAGRGWAGRGCRLPAWSGCRVGSNGVRLGLRRPSSARRCRPASAPPRSTAASDAVVVGAASATGARDAGRPLSVAGAGGIGMAEPVRNDAGVLRRAAGLGDQLRRDQHDGGGAAVRGLLEPYPHAVPLGQPARPRRARAGRRWRGSARTGRRSGGSRRPGPPRSCPGRGPRSRWRTRWRPAGRGPRPWCAAGRTTGRSRSARRAGG